MNSLPVEILLLIGLTDQKTYRSMLAVPRFARVITAGYRLNAMAKFGFNFEKCWKRDGQIYMGGNIPYRSVGTLAVWKNNCRAASGGLYIRIDDKHFNTSGSCRFRGITIWPDGGRDMEARHIISIFPDGMVYTDIDEMR